MTGPTLIVQQDNSIELQPREGRRHEQILAFCSASSRGGSEFVIME